MRVGLSWMAQTRSSARAPPKRCDLRETGYLTDIRDQMQALCCYSFAGCGAEEYYYNKKTNRKGEDRITLSPQDSYDGLVKTEKENREGKSIVEVFEWMKSQGCVLEESCKFRGTFGPPAQPRKVIFRIRGYIWVPLGQMEQYINVHGPVVVTCPWLDGMRHYSGGVYQGPTDQDEFRSNKLIKHFLVVVGYGVESVDDKDVKYWLLRNSHGVDWGEEGYCKFSQDIMHGREPLINGGYAPQGISYRDNNDKPYPTID